MAGRPEMNVRHFFAILATALAYSGATCAADVEAGSFGIFTNPTGPPAMVVSGIGSPIITWGEGLPTPSSLAFAGSTVSAPFNTDFRLGTLVETNGVTASGTQANGVQLDLTLGLTSPAFGNLALASALALDNTTNIPGDPLGSADGVVLLTPLAATTFAVGTTTYTLQLVGFANASGPGLASFSSTDLYVLENGSAQVDLMARITPVPEPETYALMLAGLATALFAFRHRKAS